MGTGCGKVRAGHEHGLDSTVSLDAGADMFDIFAGCLVQEPMLGKSSPIMPNSLQACLERNRQSMFSAM